MLGTDGLWINRLYDGPIRRVAVFGERSSGTNVSEYVLRHAFGVNVNSELGWKHGLVQGAGIAKDTLVVVSVRDPYDWVKSMYDKPWHCTDAMRNLGFSGFIRAEWESVIDRPKNYFGLPLQNYRNIPLLQDRNPITGLKYENLLRMRTTKLHHWTGLANGLCNLAIWRFEAFKQHPAAILDTISRGFDLNLRPFDWPEQPMGVMPPDKRLGKPSAISPQDTAFINSQLDAGLEQSLGYSLSQSGA